jgi:hypothetical protein
MQLRVAELDDWWRRTFRKRHELIRVTGDFRPATSHRSELDLVEFGGRNADTVRILVPPSTPVPATGHKLRSSEFSQKDDNGWWNGWASVFVAAGLAAPAVDPVRLADLVRDPRRIRFCCDTNALAGGVVSWLLVFLGQRADVVTSAVVDRELAAWPDRHLKAFWPGKTTDVWSLRTQYRLARRIVEAPPLGVVVDRLSPEQGALMLAKLRDEQKLAKSPDADVLLVELARALVRDQPRNARVVFLTGDRSNARTATGALGAENVLYAAADSDRARQLHNKIVARGAWRPEGPLGSVQVPAVASLLWDLLAPCDRLIVRTTTQQVEITTCTTIPRGAPSDWADPWVEVHELPPPTRAVSVGPGPQRNPGTVPLSSAGEHVTASNDDLIKLAKVRASFLHILNLVSLLQGKGKEMEETPSVLPGSAPQFSRGAEDPFLASMASVLPPVGGTAEQGANADVTEWLLPPLDVGTSLDLPPGTRPSPGMIFPVLVKAFGGGDFLGAHKYSDTTLDEARRILNALGALDAEGRPGVRIDVFRAAWMRRDHDWFHAEMRRLPGYAAALAFVRGHPGASRTSRQEAHVSMARALGQVARLDRLGGALVVGDAPVRRSELLDALDRWLPRPGATLETTELCKLAASELSLTPARFERAMELLWAAGSGVQFEGRTGGTVVPGFAERVIALGTISVQFRALAPGDLSFGRSGPVRFVTRVR